jgi:hypothetical protein
MFIKPIKSIFHKRLPIMTNLRGTYNEIFHDIFIELDVNSKLNEKPYAEYTINGKYYKVEATSQLLRNILKRPAVYPSVIVRYNDHKVDFALASYKERKEIIEKIESITSISNKDMKD